MIEYHAASCEGKRDEVGMDGGGDVRGAGQPEILEVNLPPENLSGRTVAGSASKTRPSSSEPAAKRAGPSASSSVRRTPSSSSSGRVECPICNEKYAKSAIEEHAANCGEEVYV